MQDILKSYLIIALQKMSKMTEMTEEMTEMTEKFLK